MHLAHVGALQAEVGDEYDHHGGYATSGWRGMPGVRESGMRKMGSDGGMKS